MFKKIPVKKKITKKARINELTRKVEKLKNKKKSTKNKNSFKDLKKASDKFDFQGFNLKLNLPRKENKEKIREIFFS